MHISMDKAEILYEKLKKRYLSLLAMWRWSAIMDKENFYYFPFQIRFYIHENLIHKYPIFIKITEILDCKI